MNLVRSLKKMAVVGMLMTAGVANANILQFNLTGGYTAQFQLDTANIPSDSAVGSGFVQYNVSGTFPGASGGTIDLQFYNFSVGGGFEIDDNIPGGQGTTAILVSTDGPQLYTGLESMPAFILGTFALTDFFGTNATYTLTIADVTPAGVPEPATGFMLLGGLAAMLAVSRRRRS